MCYSELPIPAGSRLIPRVFGHFKQSGARTSMRTSVAGIVVLCLSALGTANRAEAQYGAKPHENRATGENYHVEVGAYFWNPTPDISITSESLGIIGSTIDFVNDLGIDKTRFKQLKIVGRP